MPRSHETRQGVAGESDRQRADQTVESGLGGPVGFVTGSTVNRRSRRDRHQRAAFSLLDQDLRRFPQGQEHAVQVHRHDRAPVIQSQIHELLARTAPAGVSEQTVEPS
jgi:hypothetical protein